MVLLREEKALLPVVGVWSVTVRILIATIPKSCTRDKPISSVPHVASPILQVAQVLLGVICVPGTPRVLITSEMSSGFKHLRFQVSGINEESIIMFKKIRTNANLSSSK